MSVKDRSGEITKARWYKPSAPKMPVAKSHYRFYDEQGRVVDVVVTIEPRDKRIDDMRTAAYKRWHETMNIKGIGVVFVDGHMLELFPGDQEGLS